MFLVAYDQTAGYTRVCSRSVPSCSSCPSPEGIAGAMSRCYKAWRIPGCRSFHAKKFDRGGSPQQSQRSARFKWRRGGRCRGSIYCWWRARCWSAPRRSAGTRAWSFWNRARGGIATWKAASPDRPTSSPNTSATVGISIAVSGSVLYSSILSFFVEFLAELLIKCFLFHSLREMVLLVCA